MRKIYCFIFCFLMFSSFSFAEEGGGNNYSLYKNAKAFYIIEKEFVTNLKPPNPDDVKKGGYAKFRVTLLLEDKATAKELETKIDIVRSVILDTTSGFLAMDLQSVQGRAKMAASITASVNAILTDSKIIGAAFGDFVIQP